MIIDKLSNIKKLEEAGLSLEKELKYKFKNINLLIEAISHPSVKQINRNSKNYEKLELLGDSILGFIITEYLYKNFAHDCQEGELSKRKGHLVSRDVLCKISKNLKIDKYLIMTKGEYLSGGKDNKNNLEDALEAIIGAIYLDSNSIAKTRKFILRTWKKYLIFVNNKNINQILDPKTTLQEWAHKNNLPSPEYKLVKTYGAKHEPTFEVQVIIGDQMLKKAKGKTIKEASRIAASQMINNINI